MKRIEWIDICKAIAIFAMVFCHVGLEMPQRCKAVDEFVHYWHMPIFFILSGLVFNTVKYCGWSHFGDLAKSRVKQLLVPLFSFWVICGVYNFFVVFPDKEFSFGDMLQNLMYPNRVMWLYSIQWFLLALFTTEIISAAFFNIARGGLPAFLGICAVYLVGGHVLLKLTGVKLPFALDVTFYSVPMFGTGVALKNFLMKKRPLKHPLAQIAALGVLFGLYFLQPGKLNVRLCRYEPFWMYFLGLAVTVMVIMLIREQEWWIVKLKGYKVWKWLGTNTLAILVLNGSVRKTLPLGLLKFDNMFLTFIAQAAASAVLIAIVWLITIPIKRWAPVLLGKSRTKTAAVK